MLSINWRCAPETEIRTYKWGQPNAYVDLGVRRCQRGHIICIYQKLYHAGNCFWCWAIISYSIFILNRRTAYTGATVQYNVNVATQIGYFLRCLYEQAWNQSCVTLIVDTSHLKLTRVVKNIWKMSFVYLNISLLVFYSVEKTGSFFIIGTFLKQTKNNILMNYWRLFLVFFSIPWKTQGG